MKHFLTFFDGFSCFPLGPVDLKKKKKCSMRVVS